MNTIVVAIVTGIISSLLASSIFLIVLYRIKPNVLISSRIAKRIGEGNKVIYEIKIANFTSRPVVDINFSLYKVELISTTNAHREAESIKWLEEVPLRNGARRIPELAPFNPCIKSTDYACRITITQNIEEWWNDLDVYPRFVVYAKDGLSGLNQVFFCNYTVKRDYLSVENFTTGHLLQIWKNPSVVKHHFFGKCSAGFAIRLQSRFASNGD